MGTPDFAVPPLEALIEAGYEVVLCLSQPDKARGRKGEVTPTPVKVAAMAHGIEVLTPARANVPEIIEAIRAVKPDVLVVAAYGQLLKEELLNLAPLGAINIHASILPYYRGAAPIHWAIINGETHAGITTMKMDIGMDTGDMLLQGVIPIDDTDNTGTMHDKLALLGAELICETLELATMDLLPQTPQDHESATHAPKILRENEVIDFNREARAVFNQIRGLYPFPTSYTSYGGKVVKIHQVIINEENSLGEVGQVIGFDKEGVKVQCGKGSIKLLIVQPQGKKPMNAADFWRGIQDKTGKFA